MSERVRFGLQIPPPIRSAWSHGAAESLAGQPFLDKEGAERGEIIEARFNEETGNLELAVMVDEDFIPPGLHPQASIERVSAAFMTEIAPFNYRVPQ